MRVLADLHEQRVAARLRAADFACELLVAVRLRLAERPELHAAALRAFRPDVPHSDVHCKCPRRQVSACGFQFQAERSYGRTSIFCSLSRTSGEGTASGAPRSIPMNSKAKLS